MPCDMGFLEYGWSDGHNAFEQYFQHNMKEENKSNWLNLNNEQSEAPGRTKDEPRNNPQAHLNNKPLKS